MDKDMKASEVSTVKVYSDTGEFIDMRFGIEKEKTICGYKFVVTDYGLDFIYVGRDEL